MNKEYSRIAEELRAESVVLVAVSKTRTVEEIMELYEQGHREFGENKVQELRQKYEALPKDINWHLIGHLQTNKVKYIAPWVKLIHSVDSFGLLLEIDKQGKRSGRMIDVLLQVHIAMEETKFGFSDGELKGLISEKKFNSLQNVKVRGLMGMATNTDDKTKVRNEFRHLESIFKELRSSSFDEHIFDILSMGMSNDYTIAIEEGSTMVRIGSLIFGERNYQE